MPRRHAQRAAGLRRQTVNIAARVQGLSVTCHARYRTVIEAPAVNDILSKASIEPIQKEAALRGIADKTWCTKSRDDVFRHACAGIDVCALSKKNVDGGSSPAMTANSIDET